MRTTDHTTTQQLRSQVPPPQTNLVDSIPANTFIPQIHHLAARRNSNPKGSRQTWRLRTQPRRRSVAKISVSVGMVHVLRTSGFPPRMVGTLYAEFSVD